MWRSKRRSASFPLGWCEPKVAIRGDIFEASHTYRVRGAEQIPDDVKAQGDRRRYYKAYFAEQLEGP